MGRMAGTQALSGESRYEREGKELQVFPSSK